MLLGLTAGLLLSILESIIELSLNAILRGILLTIGALIGDLIGSFIKRRLGIKRGAPAPLLDQLDFLLFALLLAWIGGYTLALDDFIFLIIVTPLLHVGTNGVAYLLRLKSVPW